MAEKKLKKPATKTAKSKITKSEKTKKTFNTPLKQTPEVNKPTTRSLKLKRSHILIALAIFLVVTLLFLGRNLIIAATVNGMPISRYSVVRELEKQGGKSALDSLITKQLIIQEAGKKNIVISQSEVDTELKKISENLEQQGQKLDQVLSLQGMTKDQLLEQIKLQKMLEKMVGKVDITDKEVSDYIESNRDSLPTDQDEASIAANVKSSLSQQKLNTKAQEILENLRKNARINYFVQY